MPKLYPPEVLFYQVRPEDMFSRDWKHLLGNVPPIEPALPIVSVSDGVTRELSTEHQ
jgi:hypothetical protein